MTYKITLIPGDGIGPEVSRATQQVIAAAGVDIDWEVQLAGTEVINRYGTPLPEEALESIKRHKIALKGPIGTPIGKGFRSVNVDIRKRLDLYANFRPACSIKGVNSRYENVDLMVIRENTEGLYSGLEHIVVPGVVESQRIITEKGSRRIVETAFKIARKYKRKKVTAVHKANILKLSDGLFLEVAREVARNYPDIEYNETIVDATAMRLVIDPTQFDVLVMENLFGDIISDLTSGLIGGLGVAPAANIGDDYAVFEAVHGSAPDIAGKGVANPTALLLSGCMMLELLDEHDAANRIRMAVSRVIEQGKHVTPDLGGKASTQDYVRAVIAALN